MKKRLKVEKSKKSKNRRNLAKYSLCRHETKTPLFSSLKDDYDDRSNNSANYDDFDDNPINNDNNDDNNDNYESN